MKFIVISGGVLSGLGKGITAASLGLLLKSRGIKVTAMKCDMYLNIDAGTMNPLEHGEVFVTHDGLETDQDLGHYERFLDTTLVRENYLTNGQVYRIVLEKERALEYEGKCVEPYHHIPPEIIKRWYAAGEFHKSDVVIIEMGGTVGEYEGLLFFEAVRRLRLKNPKDVILVHVGYLPAPPSIGELKSKPLQQSVTQLNSIGLHPDIIVARSHKPIDLKRKEKIALASGLAIEDIIANPDMKSIYEVPQYLAKQTFATKVIKKLKLKAKSEDMSKWYKMVESSKTDNKLIRIGIVGKYQKTGDYMLEDSYVCVLEALKHAAWKQGVSPEFVWIDAESLEGKSEDSLSKVFDVEGILVPQGWGSRGVEGKIIAAGYARENKIPYLGLCFGMQMAAIEFGRNVVGLKNANSEEVNSKSSHLVIHTMENQKDYLLKKQYGGTIRLGAWPCKIKRDTILEKAYKKYGGAINSAWYQPHPKIDNQVKPKKAEIIFERHRHRYEFNNEYKKQFENKGCIISGTSPDENLVEAIELTNHPFFVGVQYHPEYLSRPLSPHPLFMAYLDAMINGK